MADRISFNCEWFDNQACQVRLFIISFYPGDSTLEMIDLKNKKVFLSRQQVSKITRDSFYLGAVLNVFSRHLKITDYADNKTMKQFEHQAGKTLALVKPDAYLKAGLIIDRVQQNGFNIVNMKMAKLTPTQAASFYQEHKGKTFYDELVRFMSSDYVLAMELMGDNVVARWRECLGPTDSNMARQTAPNSLRAQLGTDGTRNAAHGSDSPGSAHREISFFFGDDCGMAPTAVLNNCACCVIKPHLLREKKAGQVVQHILDAGYEISALQMFYLDQPTAIEFLDVYKNILPEYSALTDSLSKGACVVLEVRQDKAVEQFRETCGPHDPEIARNLRPGSIRAVFGQDRVQNAVHCTDLPEDGVLECEYFFSILQ